MKSIIHERPGVYSSYDASAVVWGGRAIRTIGVAAKSAGGAANAPVTQGHRRVPGDRQGGGHGGGGEHAGQDLPAAVQDVGAHQDHALAVEGLGPLRQRAHVRPVHTHHGDPLPPGGAGGLHAAAQGLMRRQIPAVAHNHPHVLHRLEGGEGSGVVLPLHPDGHHCGRAAQKQQPQHGGHAGGALGVLAKGADARLAAGEGHGRVGCAAGAFGGHADGADGPAEHHS